jgi:hypothetical protein
MSNGDSFRGTMGFGQFVTSKKNDEKRVVVSQEKNIVAEELVRNYKVEQEFFAA